MSKKRKSEASKLDEIDRTMYSAFSSAANSLSQLYTQAMHHQKVSFQAGERHALEKLYQWILRQHEEGSRVTVADIVANMQNEITYGGEDVSMSPRLPPQHQYPQSMQPASGFPLPSVGLSLRTNLSDQTKNSVFSNALSSPIRRSLQPYHLAQGGENPDGNGTKNHELNTSGQTREHTSFGSTDTSMDMHSDSPIHESY
ncbi:hypothetical protein J5N97_019256 [Dioscorea zingiberensis]|uniref:Holocarboxylase synthetase n=1 Tax=Dioscorea zingiberensis TaxID=325984 RepID=A0A9D5HCJ0_9LILI|nr:hypothetical protein J5N97_019256 [Dioscorea zingiberensis]